MLLPIAPLQQQLPLLSRQPRPGIQGCVPAIKQQLVSMVLFCDSCGRSHKNPLIATSRRNSAHQDRRGQTDRVHGVDDPRHMHNYEYQRVGLGLVVYCTNRGLLITCLLFWIT
jgi:hypothetical protein